MALAPDGKVVIAGVRHVGALCNAADFLTLARDSNGNTAWSAQTNIQSTPPPPMAPPGVCDPAMSSDIGNSLAIRPDGSPVVVGSSHHFDMMNPNIDHDALAQYTPAGAPDTSFDVDGSVLGALHVFGSGESQTIGRAALQPSGKLLHSKDIAFGQSGVIRRYNTDGTLDTGFQSSGTLATPIHQSGVNGGYEIEAQFDGKFLLAGAVTSGGPGVLLRYGVDGDLDTGFGTGGTATPPVASSISAIALEPDGDILVAGGSDLTRFTSAGIPDATFGTGGSTFSDLDLPFGGDIEGIAIQPDGKIIVSGGTQQPNFQTGVARFNPDGSPDTTFAPGGDRSLAINPNGEYNFYSMAQVLLQSDGRIVLGGSEYSLARLVGGTGPDLGPDTTPPPPPPPPSGGDSVPVTSVSAATTPAAPAATAKKCKKGQKLKNGKCVKKKKK